jgi:hypothetical protein
MQWLGGTPAYQTTLDVSRSPALQHFREGSNLALERYQPRFYPGKINFTRAAISTGFPADQAGVWARLTQQFDLESVRGAAGNHDNAFRRAGRHALSLYERCFLRIVGAWDQCC